MFFHDLQVTALRKINDSAANVPVCEAISKVLCFPKVFKLVYRLQLNSTTGTETDKVNDSS